MKAPKVDGIFGEKAKKIKSLAKITLTLASELVMIDAVGIALKLETIFEV